MTPLDPHYQDLVAGGANRKPFDAGPPPDLPLVAPPFSPVPIGID